MSAISVSVHIRQRVYLGERAGAEVGGRLAAVGAEVLGALEVTLLGVRRPVGVHLVEALLRWSG